MTYSDELRLIIFKRQIMDNNLHYLQDLPNEELLNLLNLSVMPNALDSKTVRYGFLFHLLFCENTDKKERLLNQIERLRKLELQLTKTERMIIKFGIIYGFTSKNYRVQLFRYLKNPISKYSFVDGKKFCSSLKFKEIFSFAYNLVKRGEKNERFPKY